jgi:hypothetical protein
VKSRTADPSTCHAATWLTIPTVRPLGPPDRADLVAAPGPAVAASVSPLTSSGSTENGRAHGRRALPGRHVTAGATAYGRSRAVAAQSKCLSSSGTSRIGGSPGGAEPVALRPPYPRLRHEQPPIWGQRFDQLIRDGASCPGSQPVVVLLCRELLLPPLGHSVVVGHPLDGTADASYGGLEWLRAARQLGCHPPWGYRGHRMIN